MTQNTPKEEYGSFDIIIKDKHYHFAPSIRKPKHTLIYFGALLGCMMALMLLLTGIVYGLAGLSILLSMISGTPLSIELFTNPAFFAGTTTTATLGILVYGYLFSYNKEPKKDASSATVKSPI